MDQKLSVGFFMLGCVIITATVLAFIHIRELEQLVREQQHVIETQEQANSILLLENMLLRGYK
jgi:CHASE3 domain sensor protein